MKYYFTIRAASPVIGEGMSFTFNKTFTANGAVMGVYATDKEDEQKALDSLVAGKRIQSISKDIYERELKKNKKSLPRSLAAEPILGYQENPQEDASPAESNLVESDDEPEEIEEEPLSDNEHSLEEAEETIQVEKPKRKSRKKKSGNDS
jgi:hypothetical protein